MTVTPAPVEDFPRELPGISHAPHSSGDSLRPPAVPLITLDPHLSIWSMSDKLYGRFPQHWTGQNHSMTCLVRVDRKCYRVMGPQPAEVRSARQLSLRVLPTRTIYEFQVGPVKLSLTFTTPALPDDLHQFSFPLTYLTFSFDSLDNKPHAVRVYFDACAELVVDEMHQAVSASRLTLPGATLLSFGTTQQQVLSKSGDDRRIDWGFLYLALPDAVESQTYVGPKQDVQIDFASDGSMPDADDLRWPRAVSDGWPALAAAFNVAVQPGAACERWLMLAYDDLFSIEYLQRKMKAYWNRGKMGVAKLLSAGLRDYDRLVARCRNFDDELMADLTQAGGPKYAQIAALAYRQTIAAHKLVADIDGTPMYFSKENFSNGCIGTVDVTYPSAPFFLLFNPDLLKAQLTPILEYASTPRWKFPFAPHDLGTYPLANGQVYGGGETSEKYQMPVEECGNMLLMVAALSKVQNDTSYAKLYWPVLRRWADYLVERGFDPEKQLCTDDFAGRLAHNTNLSIKAILALGAYADLCKRAGYAEDAAAFRQSAEGMVHSWITHADDGDHYRLAFNKPGTWSMKYNLVWDHILELGLFPETVLEKELAFYRRQSRRFGLPLDSRKAYTKLDWIFWVAYLAPDRAGFNAFVDPVFKFLNETSSRVPLPDWYWTTTGRQVRVGGSSTGFQARSVVGAVFIELLKHKDIWQKYLSRAAESRRQHHQVSEPSESVKC